MAKKITHTSRGWRQDQANISKQAWEVNYQKGLKNKRRGSKKSGGVVKDSFNAMGL